MESPAFKRNWARRQLIINPRFQFRVIAYAVFLSLVVVAVLYGANQYFLYKFLKTGQALGIPENHVYFEFLREQGRFMDRVFMATAGVVTALIGGFCMVFSHRIAGQVYRLCKHLLEVSEGKTDGDVSFRKNDYFPEIAESLNRHLRDYRELKARKIDKAG